MQFQTLELFLSIGNCVLKASSTCVESFWMYYSEKIVVFGDANRDGKLEEHFCFKYGVYLFE
jgi:hypothetical protein